MATVTVLTASRMIEIENGLIVSAEIVDGELILTKHDASEFDPIPIAEAVDPAVLAADPAFVDEYVSIADFLAQGPSGKELAFAESTVYQFGIAATPVDLTGLSITFTVGARPVYVELDLPWVSTTATPGGAAAIIADGAGAAKRLATQAFGASETRTYHVFERISTPGTYTRKAQLQRGSGTGSFSNGLDNATIVSSISATER